MTPVARRTSTVLRVSDMPQQPIAGRYRLVRPLGQGGQGRVWLARDEMLRRDVAVKELVPPDGLSGPEQRELRARSMREARTIARINQTNVVRIFDVVVEGGMPWIVMELVTARPLHQVLGEDGPMTPRQAARVGLGVLAALRAAHEAGVLHRDVKPANVLLAPDGRVVLTDFGLAMAAEDPSLTRTGVVLGSPAFLAPERALDEPAGPASDLWSLGAMLYLAVEGRSPYQRSTAIATLAALSTELPPPPERAGTLLPALEGLLRRDPAARVDAETAERLLHRALTETAPPGDGPSGTFSRAGSPAGPLPAGATFSRAGSPAGPLPVGATFGGAHAAPVAAPPRRRRLLVAVLGLVALLAVGAGALMLTTRPFGTEAGAARQSPGPGAPVRPGPSSAPAEVEPAPGPEMPPVPSSAKPSRSTKPKPRPSRTRSTPAAPPPAADRPLRNVGTATCADVPNSDPGSPAPLQSWPCNDTAGQRFSLPGDGTVRVLGRCLRADGSADGTTLTVATCTGEPAQQFDLNAASDLVTRGSGKCLEVPWGDRAPGVPVRLIGCGGENHQKWVLG